MPSIVFGINGEGGKIVNEGKKIEFISMILAVEKLEVQVRI
jgi:hypothetical protein